MTDNDLGLPKKKRQITNFGDKKYNFFMNRIS